MHRFLRLMRSEASASVFLVFSELDTSLMNSRLLEIWACFIIITARSSNT